MKKWQEKELRSYYFKSMHELIKLIRDKMEENFVDITKNELDRSLKNYDQNMFICNIHADNYGISMIKYLLKNIKQERNE